MSITFFGFGIGDFLSAQAVIDSRDRDFFYLAPTYPSRAHPCPVK
jgi:hypothetical protein